MTKESIEAYLAPRSRNSFAVCTILAALAVAAAVLAFFGWQHFTKSRGLDEQLARLQTAQSTRAVPTPNQRQVEESKQWMQVRVERDFPWDRVFHAIERTASPDIELLEFHPDKLNHVIVLRGEAKSIDALLAYLQDLTVKTGWREVHLTHQEKVKHGTLETISFEVKATLGS